MALQSEVHLLSISQVCMVELVTTGQLLGRRQQMPLLLPRQAGPLATCIWHLVLEPPHAVLVEHFLVTAALVEQLFFAPTVVPKFCAIDGFQ